MKTQLYILFIAILFISCAGTKKISTSNSADEQHLKTEVSKNNEIKESGSSSDKSSLNADLSVKKSIDQIEKETQEFEARLITYDTDKPVDPITGRPPVASELTMSRKNTADKKTLESENKDMSVDAQSQSKNDNSKVEKSKSDSTNNRDNIKKLQTETISDKSGSSWSFWLLIGAGLTVFIYMIIRYRWWKKLSFLFELFK